MHTRRSLNPFGRSDYRRFGNGLFSPTQMRRGFSVHFFHILLGVSDPFRHADGAIRRTTAGGKREFQSNSIPGQYTLFSSLLLTEPLFSPNLPVFIIRHYTLRSFIGVPIRRYRSPNGNGFRCCHVPFDNSL